MLVTALFLILLSKKKGDDVFFESIAKVYSFKTKQKKDCPSILLLSFVNDVRILFAVHFVSVDVLAGRDALLLLAELLGSSHHGQPEVERQSWWKSNQFTHCLSWFKFKIFTYKHEHQDAEEDQNGGCTQTEK